MARTNIDSTYFKPDSDGTAAVAAVAADITNGNTFTNDGAIVLVVQNTNSTTAQNVTFDIPSYRDVDGQVVPSKVVSVPAASTMYFRLPVNAYGDDVAVDGATIDLQFSLIR